MEKAIEHELSTDEALAALARHVARGLVARELKALVGAPVTVTVHSDALPRRALPAAPRRVAKKEKTPRTYRPLEQRLCRGCFKKGTLSRLAGSERTVKCSSCGTTSEARGLGDAPPAPATPAKGAPAARPGAFDQHLDKKLSGRERCQRCDHTKGEHCGDGNRCLSLRCVCQEFRA